MRSRNSYFMLFFVHSEIFTKDFNGPCFIFTQQHAFLEILLLAKHHSRLWRSSSGRKKGQGKCPSFKEVTFKKQHKCAVRTLITWKQNVDKRRAESPGSNSVRRDGGRKIFVQTVLPVSFWISRAEFAPLLFPSTHYSSGLPYISPGDMRLVRANKAWWNAKAGPLGKG